MLTIISVFFGICAIITIIGISRSKYFPEKYHEECFICNKHDCTGCPFLDPNYLISN